MPPARPGRVRRRSGLLSFFSGVGPWVALWLVAVVFSYTALTHKPAGGGPRRGYPTGYDANGYYAWARSLWFDGDMDFRNDFAFVARTQPPGSRDPFVAALLEADAAGRGPDNVFNCGTGLAALPAMAIASGLDRIRVAVSGGPPASPFSPWYVFAFQIMHAAYGVGALMLARTLAARLYGRHAANVGSWGAMLCGPPVFYLLFEPGMSHLAGAFFGSVCAVSWASTFAPGGTRAAPERPRVGLAAVAGLAAGFATCVRPYNLPLGLLLVEPAVRAVLSSNRRRDFGPAMAWSAVGLAGAAVGFAPQLAVWRAQYGTWLGNPTGFRFLPWPPFAHLVLFGARHGLFQWAPLYLAGLVGLVFSACRLPSAGAPWSRSRFRSAVRRRVAAGLLAVFLGVTYMYGCWWYYWLGSAFGQRGYVDLAWLFAVGLAAAGSASARRVPHRDAWLVVAMFALLNLHLAIAWRGGALWSDGPLVWRMTVDDPVRTRRYLRLEWSRFTDWTPSRRGSLLDTPPGH